MKAKKDETQAKKSAYTGATVRWCNTYLSDEQASLFQDTVLSESETLAEIMGLVQDGYSLSCKKSRDGASIQATCICTNDKSPNHNIGISAFAGSVHLALALLLFKHYQILDGTYTFTESVGKRAFG